MIILLTGLSRHRHPAVTQAPPGGRRWVASVQNRCSCLSNSCKTDTKTFTPQSRLHHYWFNYNFIRYSSQPIIHWFTKTQHWYKGQVLCDEILTHEWINSPSTVSCSLNCCWCCWALLRISLNLRSSSDSKLSPESGQTEARYWASAWCSPTRNWRPLPWEYSHSAFRLVIWRGRMIILMRRTCRLYHLLKKERKDKVAYCMCLSLLYSFL